MIRRFEIYSVHPEGPAARVRALETAFRQCGRYIPEVLHGAVGWNQSDASADFVWEHAFASPEAYQRYMVHPYHADVLDRYLLHDAPERVVTDNDLGAGLVGYTCDEPRFALSGGLRRLVLLRLRRQASPAAVDRLAAVLGDAPGEADELLVSVVAANTLGAAWFDGVTPVAGRPRWTHLWEQGFLSADHLDAYLDGPSPVADAERRRWTGAMGDVVERAVSIHYEIDGPRPGRADQVDQE